MKFHKDLFVDENIKYEESIKEALINSVPVFNIYLICVEKGSRNMFDILSSSEYFKERNQKKGYIIIGIALGKRGSFNLTAKIFEWWLEVGSSRNKRDNLSGLKQYFIRG